MADQLTQKQQQALALARARRRRAEAEAQQKQEQHHGGPLRYVEPALTAASAFLAEPAAGVAGMATAMIPGTAPGSGAGVVEGVRNAMTYQPRSEAGRQGLQGMGEVLQPIGDAFQSAGDTLGHVGSVIAEPINPALGHAIGASMPTAAAEALGLGMASRAPRAAAAAGRAVPAPVRRTGRMLRDYQKPSTREIAQRIKAGSRDSDLAPFNVRQGTDGPKGLPAPEQAAQNPTALDRLALKMDEGGIRTDPDAFAKSAMDQGFDPGVLQPLKQANEATRKQMLRMVDRRQKNLADNINAIDNPTHAIAGEGLVDRFMHLHRTNKDAASKLEKVADKLKTKPVDVDDAVRSFIDDMDRKGVVMNDDMTVSFTPDSIFRGLKPEENLIKAVVKRMREFDHPTAYSAHTLKRWLDQQINYNKKMFGAAAEAEGIIQRLRTGIDKVLDSTFPEYDAVNSTYSGTRRALDEFQTAAGKRYDLTQPFATQRVGSELRKIMSNYGSRQELLAAINNIDTAAKKFGGKFDDDARMLAMFANELDRVIGPEGKSTFQAQISQANVDSARQVAGAATGNMQDVGNLLAGAAIKGVNKARGRSPEKSFKAIRALLRSAGAR